MLLLVTDTSGKQGSVALARAREDDRDQNALELIEVAPLAGGAFSAQLVPQIAALLAKHDFTKTEIDAFIVVSGPGSFTGLRVGLAAIKALAEVLKKPIVPVSLLEVLALASGRQAKFPPCWMPVAATFTLDYTKLWVSRCGSLASNCYRRRNSYLQRATRL